MDDGVHEKSELPILGSMEQSGVGSLAVLNWGCTYQDSLNFGM